MEYTALWGPKGFIISPSKIVPLMNLSTSFSVKADNGNDTSGSAVTNDRGRELQKVSLSTLYVRGAGVDPRGQIAEWEALIGRSYPLYIEGRRFGPPNLKLKSIDVSDVLLSNTGKFLQCAIAINFEEYSDQTTKNKTSVTTTAATTPASAAQAAATYQSIVEQKKQALNATPSRAERAALLTERKLTT